MQHIVGQACKDHNTLAKNENDKIPIIALANWCSVPHYRNLINNEVTLCYCLSFNDFVSNFLFNKIDK